MGTRQHRRFGPSCGNDMNSNPYVLLGLKNWESDYRLIKKRGRALKASVHPDKNPNNQYAQEMFVLAGSATDLLLDRKKKQLCDEEILRRDSGNNDPYGNDVRLLDNFYRRQMELEHTSNVALRKKLLSEYIKSIKDLPRRCIRNCSRFIRRSYKVQSGRVGKAWRNLKRWLWVGVVKPPRRTSRSARTSTISRIPKPVTATPTKIRETIISERDEGSVKPESNFSVTGDAPTRTFSITETETVTKTETETETVTVFGVNVAKHRHDATQFIRTITPHQMGAGAAIAVCAAGCYFIIKSYQRRRARVGIPDGGAGTNSLDEEDGSEQSQKESLDVDDETAAMEGHHTQIGQDGQGDTQVSEGDERPDGRDEGAEDIAATIEGDATEVDIVGPKASPHGIAKPLTGHETLEPPANSLKDPSKHVVDAMDVDRPEQFSPKPEKRKNRVQARSTDRPKRSTRARTPAHRR